MVCNSLELILNFETRKSQINSNLSKTSSIFTRMIQSIGTSTCSHFVLYAIKLTLHKPRNESASPVPIVVLHILFPIYNVGNHIFPHIFIHYSKRKSSEDVCKLQIICCAGNMLRRFHKPRHEFSYITKLI